MTEIEGNKLSFLGPQRWFGTNSKVCLRVFLLLFPKQTSEDDWNEKINSRLAVNWLTSWLPNATLRLRWFVPARSWRGDACLYTSPYTAPCFHDPSGHAWSLSTAHPQPPPSQPPGALRHRHMERTESCVVPDGRQSQAKKMKKNGNLVKLKIALTCSTQLDLQ